MQTDGAPWLAQPGARVLVEWGTAAIDHIPAEVVVIIDVLRFTTAVDVAVGAGAVVYPYRWKDGSAEGFARDHRAHLADGSTPGAMSLSPHRLTGVRPGERIVLPSPNGSTCAARAAERGSRVVAGCLRNLGAVTEWLRQHAAGVRVLIVPCGERWPDGSLRPALEDLLGAGAIAAGLAAREGGAGLSAEASAAAALWDAGEAGEAIRRSVSGREQKERGWEQDLELALQVDASGSVPVLRAGAFVDDR